MKAMTPQQKKYVYLSTTKTKDIFTINGCGKFQESKKHLNQLEASMLYLELHKWLFPSKK